MSEISESGAGRSAALSYLRRPQFGADDLRGPRAAMLHALPAFLFLGHYVWLVGGGLLWFIDQLLSLPVPILVALAVILAIPCFLLSWAIFVRCVEFEATTK